MDQLTGINHLRLKRVFMGRISAMHCTENDNWPEFSRGHRLK